jgi:hypothetical protein
MAGTGAGDRAVAPRPRLQEIRRGEVRKNRLKPGAFELPPPLTPPHKGEGGVNVAESPSPLWGGVRGGGNFAGHSGAGIAMTTPGFGVYVHWPFCAAKCPYCDFNSHVRHQPVDQERFAAAFERELATMRARPGRARCQHLPRRRHAVADEAGDRGAVLDAIAKNWTMRTGIEVTLEANPSSVEAERFRGYRAAGVNRVSLGVQALNDPDLRFLGRCTTSPRRCKPSNSPARSFRACRST